MADTSLAQKNAPGTQFDVVPCKAALGAEIRGFDINALDDASFKRIHDVWLDNVMLVFRGQDVSAEDLVRFRRAGRPELAEQIVPGHFGDEAMATRPDGACVHLGQPGLPHHCSIYDVRPSICGEFERGSAQCLEARRYAARAG